MDTDRAPVAAVDIEAGTSTFASGLLLELIASLRETRPGTLIGLRSADPSVPADLEAWSRLTGNAIVHVSSDETGTRWIIRHGAVPVDPDESDRPLGSRLWLYTNFDCNLQCDYCCVRSSPTANKRHLGLERVRRIAREAADLGVREFFLTGGEPFLLPDIADIAAACADVAPTTLLTNAMLFKGTRLDALRAMPRSVILQISVDSPTPDLHDRHRGAGAWARTMEGIAIARAEGFRVRLAATVADPAAANALDEFFDGLGVARQDRLIRPIVLRGFASDGVALSRMDLVPEITITAEGVYWHPVGAEDADLLVTRDIFPLARAFDAAHSAVERERAHATRLASIFRCA